MIRGRLKVPPSLAWSDNGPVPVNEARLSYGVAEPEQIREAVRRLARAAREATTPRRVLVGST